MHGEDATTDRGHDRYGLNLEPKITVLAVPIGAALLVSPQTMGILTIGAASMHG
jgi:hypothetical protein